LQSPLSSTSAAATQNFAGQLRRQRIVVSALQCRHVDDDCGDGGGDGGGDDDDNNNNNNNNNNEDDDEFDDDDHDNIGANRVAL
jgi:hypothetical protein